EFGQSVALIFIAQILHGDAPLLESGHDLLGFLDRHARIIGAVNDHHRTFDFVYVMDGADFLKEIPMLTEVAVLRFAMGTTVGPGFLHESDEVGNTDHVYAGGPQVRVMRD